MLRPYSLYLILLVILFSCSDVGQIDLEVDLTAEMTMPKSYHVYYTENAPKVDGIERDEVWGSADWTDPFIDIQGVDTAKYKTRVKMLWDSTYLYILARLEEPHIWGDITERDAVIFHNNDFEVFIDPTSDTRRYGEIEINALGTVWDLMLDKPYRVGGEAIDYWNLPDLQSAVYHGGTLNDPSDIDCFWMVELAIPLDAYIDIRQKPASLPKVGDYWRINFSRVHWDHAITDGRYQRATDHKGELLPEYNWVWTSQGVINMHEPEKWGYLFFSGKDQHTTSAYPDTHQVEQALFALHRMLLRGDLPITDLAPGSVQRISAQVSADTTYDVQLLKTYSGYELSLGQVSGQWWSIDEDGLLKAPERRD